MRWQGLFADLEAQLEAAEQAELAGEVADRTRREAAAVRLGDRLRAATGHHLRLHLLGGATVTGAVMTAGGAWVLVEEPGGSEALVPGTALAGVSGLPSAVAPPEGPVSAWLGLGAVLRGIARDRSAVTLVLVDGSGLTGTLDRVGQDFVEVAEHPGAEVRRRTEVRGVRAVPFAAVAAVRRRV